MNRWLIYAIAVFLVLMAGRLQAGTALLLDLDGPVGPASADYLLRGMASAEKRGASTVILRINTPGGLDTAMRDIIQGILESPVPVIGYVAPAGSRAASAGTYILYACHVAAMAPATNLGAATPVQIGGAPGMPDSPEPNTGDERKQSQDKPASPGEGAGHGNDGEKQTAQPPREAPSNASALRNKAVNDARAYIRGLAELRGRNAEWAESAVTAAATLTASEALEMKVIDLVADDLDDLLAQLNGRSVKVGRQSVTLATENARLISVAPDWRTRFLGVITNPSVAYILLMVGIYGLILEFSNPGIGVGGVVGAICLLLALYALQLLPVSYSALGLLLFGLVLMVAEALSPSFGILGFGGIVAFVIGSIMLMDTDLPGFQIALPLILSVAAVTAGYLMLVIGMLMKTRHRAAVSGVETMVGLTGEVVQIRHSEALVRVRGELWQARCAVPLAPGNRVRVVGVSGLQLDVIKETST